MQLIYNSFLKKKIALYFIILFCYWLYLLKIIKYL